MNNPVQVVPLFCESQRGSARMNNPVIWISARFYYEYKYSRINNAGIIGLLVLVEQLKSAYWVITGLFILLVEPLWDSQRGNSGLFILVELLEQKLTKGITGLFILVEPRSCYDHFRISVHFEQSLFKMNGLCSNWPDSVQIERVPFEQWFEMNRDSIIAGRPYLFRIAPAKPLCAPASIIKNLNQFNVFLTVLFFLTNHILMRFLLLSLCPCCPIVEWSTTRSK
jgi:hypothetical protein